MTIFLFTNMHYTIIEIHPQCELYKRSIYLTLLDINHIKKS
uniref:Uncharacterized protein n=1 Tax=Arundo donax TaxID=35708 RepID=A0A0A8ZYR4_ARUDO